MGAALGSMMVMASEGLLELPVMLLLSSCMGLDEAWRFSGRGPQEGLKPQAPAISTRALKGPTIWDTGALKGP